MLSILNHRKRKNMIKFLNKIWLYNSPANVAKRMKNNPSYIIIFLLVISNLFAWQSIFELERERKWYFKNITKNDKNTMSNRLLIKDLGRQFEPILGLDPIEDLIKHFPNAEYKY